MVRYSNVEIPLAGVDQYSDAPYVLKGNKVATAENYRMRAPPKLQPRYAMTQFGISTLDSTTIGTVYQIVGHRKETLICTPSVLYSFDSVSGKWGNKGGLSECLVSRYSAFSDYSQSPTDGDCAYNSGIYVVAWTGVDESVNAVVIDGATEAVLASFIQTGAGSGDKLIEPRVIAVGSYIYILTQPAAGSAINYTRIDVTSGNYTFAVPASLTLTGTPSSAVAFDACPWSSSTFLVTYYDSAGTKVYVDKISTSTHAATATRNDTKTSCTCLGLCQASATLGYVVHCGTGGTAGLNVYAFADDLVTTGTSTLSGTTTIRGCGLAATSSTRGIACWEAPAAGGYRATLVWRDFSNVAALGTARQCRDVVPVSKPITYNAITYVLAVNNSDVTRSTPAAQQESTYYLLQIGTSTATVAQRLVAYAARGLAKPTVLAGYLSGWAVNGTKHDTVTSILARFKFAKDDDDDKLLARSSMARTRFDFDTTNLHSSAEWAHGRFFAGGRPGWYDGQAVTEHGFPWGPDWVDSAVTVIAGNTLEVGVYQVASTYEHEDAAGYITRSLPSPYYEKTTTVGNEGLQIVLDHQCDLTSRTSTSWGAGTIRVQHWKTLVDATEPLYKAVAGEPENTAGFVIDVGTTCILDQTDALAPGEEVLYTTGEILDNGPTPPCKVALRHGDRIFLAGLEDPELVAFSQPFVAGEQPRFNEALVLRFPEAVTALGSLDSTLVVFTASSTFVVSGDGPPATGGLDLGFSVTSISRSVGCTQPRSVVTTPKGCMFLSLRGIYMLDRGLALSWVGAPVADSTLATPVCTGSAVDPAHPEVMFWLRNAADTGRGVRLVYQYELDQWFTDTLPRPPAEVGFTDTRPTCGGVSWRASLSREVLVQGLSNSTILFESQAYPPVEYSDYIETKFESAWIALKEVQGWELVRRALFLLEYTDPPAPEVIGGVALTVSVGYDYDDTYVEDHTWTGTTLASLGKPARGTLICVGGASLIDGETFTVSDGTTAVVFEFDSNASVGVGNETVTFTALLTAEEVRDIIVSAINGVGGFGVTATAYLANVVVLTNDNHLPAGNVTITETVADAGFVVSGMTGGHSLCQIEVHTGRIECEAIRFKLLVTGTADDGGAISIRGMLLEAGIGARAMQLAAGAQT